MAKPFSILASVLLLLLASGSAGAQEAATAAGASARAFAVKVVVPGAQGVEAGAVAAPPDAVSFGGAFAYPADGSAVASGAITASASSSSEDGAAAASASSEVQALSLFGGEVTAGRVVAKATAQARDGKAAGDLSGAAVADLVVGGQAVDTSQPGARIALGDWGYAIVLAQGAAPAETGYRGFVTALEIHLNADHGGLPAGTTVFVGYAEAAAALAPKPKKPAGPPATATATTEERPTTTVTTSKAKPREGKAASARTRRAPPVVRRPVPVVEPKLTPGGYVFPVHGPASFTDTFGAARAIVDWHHGEDIFAPIGAPVLAVADGTLFSVGWNDVGGNRLWLRDERGNEFYYAHLSAFSSLAVNGTRVRAGDVVGFVGNSGDAETTPPHLHFEIHPVSLLGLGYDGVINPYRHLLAWKRLEDVRLVAGARWAPSLAQSSSAPAPGAFLLSSTDISSASGLEPGSLARALRATASAEEVAAASDAG